MGHPRRHRILLGAGVVAGTLALGLVVASTILLPRFRFPEPTGPNTIGTTSYHWVDADRPEILGPNPGGPRELMVQVWYPAKPVAGEPSPYIPDADTVIPALARIFGLPSLALNHLRGVTTHAVDNAPAASDAERYPVVLMMSGLGGFRQSTTFLAEELVSHGHIVVGIDLTYAAAAVAFPDGRAAEMSSIEEMKPLAAQSYLPAPEAPVVNGVRLEHGMIPFLGEDVSFVIDQLERLDGAGAGPVAGRLDLDRLGVAGVSLGGLVGGEVARVDPRIRAALLMDVAVPLQTVEAGLDVPTMWITRPPEAMRAERERMGGWPEAEIEAHHRTMRQTFDTLRARGYFVQIPEIAHIDFTDAPLYSPVFRWMGFSGPREAGYSHRVIAGYAVPFFEGHLGGSGIADLDGIVAAHPEVILEVHEAPNQ